MQSDRSKSAIYDERMVWKCSKLFKEMRQSAKDDDLDRFTGWKLVADRITEKAYLEEMNIRNGSYHGWLTSDLW